ncbi:MAG: GTP 3',8-cyclase MoaA [Natronospirillum sp.]
MLMDHFGRRFYYLRLSVTEVCNFRCTYCLPNGYQGADRPTFLTTAEIRRLLSTFTALGTRKVRLTGGEPSIRKDLPEIIEIAHHTLGIERVALTTNGYRLPRQVKQWRDAGLDQINVSMDSLDAQQFKAITGHDRLREVLQGVEKAIALGLDVKINVVYMKGVNDQLSRYLDWLRTMPVTLRFIEVMEIGDQPDFHAHHHISLQATKQQLLLEGWQSIVRRRDAGPAEEFWHPDYAGRIGLIMPYGAGFCASCNRLRVSAQGKLHLCLFGEQGYELRPWLQSDTDADELAAVIQRALGNKTATHGLHEHNVGATRDLSMLGG